MICDTCEGCPLTDRPHVPAQRAVPLGPALVGEAPGRNEVREGQPFVGRAGQLLRATLEDVGVDPQSVWITNACLCRPPKNETPTEEMVQSCRPRLLDELRSYKPNALLLCGNTAIQAILPGAMGVTKIRGMPIWHSGLQCYVVPTFHPAAILRNPGYYKDFHDDVGLWHELMGLEKVNEPPDDLEYFFVETFEGLEEMCRRVRKAGEGFLDLETTGLDPFSDRIISIGISTDPETVWIIPESTFRNLPATAILRDLLEDTAIWWAGHNGPQFDSRFLRADLDIDWAVSFDSLLGHYILDERQGGHGLKRLASRHFLAPDYTFDFKNFDPDDPDQLDDLYWYHALDMRYTALWANKCYESLEDADLLRVHDDVLFPASIALGHVEDCGIKVNRAYLKEVDDDLTAELADDLKSMQIASGKEDFNPNSPKQVKELLCDKLHVLPPKSSTAKDKLEAIADDVPIAKAILDYRLKSKLQSTYIRGLLDRADENDRVHADFLLFGTETGRLSARHPNLQNIPQLAGPIIRRAFIAEPDWLIVEVDYSQLELRVAAYYSRDDFLLKAYHEDLDVHTLVAAEVYHVPYEDVTFNQRYTAKYIDFGIIYGRGAYSLAKGELKCGVNEAQTYIDNFLGRFHKLHDWIKEQHKFAVENGYVDTPFGRQRRFPLVVNDNIGDIERRAVNTPIQSLASDINITALARLQDRLDPTKAKIVSTVHDSILFEIKKGCFAEIVPIIKEEMEENCQIPITEIVPLEVDFKVGVNWGDGKEMTGEEAISFGDRKSRKRKRARRKTSSN